MAETEKNDYLQVGDVKITFDELIENNKDRIPQLIKYGVLLTPNSCRKDNHGNSNYATKLIQSWSIWCEYTELTSWDDDIVKRVLRTKNEGGMTPRKARMLDYKKIIHDCQERIRQLELSTDEEYNKAHQCK